jgi:hypothetical protein
VGTLTYYGSSVADATLTTACDCASATGGTETSKTTTVTGTLVYVEIVSQAATIASVSSIPSTPTGKGWVAKPGAGTFATGNWGFIETSSCTAPGTSDHTVRFFKYNGSTYTLIGTINKTGIVGAKTTYTYTNTSMSSITFAATDFLYIDLWHHDTTGADDNPVIYVSTSATSGVANDMQVTTSTFTASLRIFDGLGGLFS